MFSRRVPDSLGPNALSLRATSLREAGERVLDLTESNPTRAGLDYPASLADVFSGLASIAYDPHPLGLEDARNAVAADYARRGVDVSPERIVLTTSTSESYAMLFKVLCDPGDEVLVPRPSYPLFEHLTALEGVRAVPYPLVYDGLWHVDAAALERALSPRTRAIVVVSPNNPTGSLLRGVDHSRLVDACAARGLAIVSDEVFADYPIEAGADAAGSVARERGALAFSLGGLSKTLGLPQMKLGWIAVNGPDALVANALARLEYVSDAFLSVAMPVQLAAARLFELAAPVRCAIRRRVAANYRAIVERSRLAPACDVLRVEGGWSVVVRVPAIASEEQIALDLLDVERVLVHPGYFYDFPHEAFLVLSLLTPEPAFAEGVGRVFDRSWES
jgi:alanine-synthesizing transaminase